MQRTEEGRNAREKEGEHREGKGGRGEERNSSYERTSTPPETVRCLLHVLL